jgi:F-type H+-transporting ATPase subunit a
LMIFPIAEGVSMKAGALIESVPWFTSSIFVTIVVTLLIVVLARRATHNMQLVPAGGQNLFEALISGLYETFEGIVGKHMIPHVFSLLATLFIFILTANWFGLLPGVGTIGFGEITGPLHTLSHVDHPLLRSADADLNMTLAMAALFMVLWLYWSLREAGVGGFIYHIFGPKGGLKGALAWCLMPIFFFVGIIEVVSIVFRPVSLSLRLYGNIYAGESLLDAMGSLGDKLPAPFSYLLSVVIPLPFYFLELLVGLLQALVFTLLCSVYIQLSTSHDEEEDHGH